MSRMKRTCDVALALFLLVLFAPCLVVIPLLIRWGSEGPVIYKADRLGKGGKPIKIYKFRTMYLDADERMASVLKASDTFDREWSRLRKIREDPRCTPVGRILRRYSLDELPQLLNVLQGSMSIVGPRPYLPCDPSGRKDRLFERYATIILSVKPGLTGMWQTSGRNLLTHAERIRMDCLYVEKRNFFLDLYLIIKTIPHLFAPQGAC